MAKITHYDVGDMWQPQATFTVGGVATDPSTILVLQKDEAGTISTLYSGGTGTLTSATTPVAKTGTGVFKLNPGVDLDAPGYWFVKFEGTAGVVAAEQQQAVVDPDEFSTVIADYALVSLAEAKDWLQRMNVEQVDDLELSYLVNDISQAFSEEAGREFKPQVSETRNFAVDEKAYRTGVVDVGDLASISTASGSIKILADDWTTVVDSLDSTEVKALPETRRSYEPIRRIQFSRYVTARPTWGQFVQVTGIWGFPSIPGRVKRAVLHAIAEEYDRDVENYRQDIAPATGGEGTNVIMFPARPQLISLPVKTVAVARSYQDPSVG